MKKFLYLFLLLALFGAADPDRARPIEEAIFGGGLDDDDGGAEIDAQGNFTTTGTVDAAIFAVLGEPLDLAELTDVAHKGVPETITGGWTFEGTTTFATIMGTSDAALVIQPGAGQLLRLRDNAGNIRVTVSGTNVITSGTLLPDPDNSRYLGTVTNRWLKTYTYEVDAATAVTTAEITATTSVTSPLVNATGFQVNGSDLASSHLADFDISARADNYFIVWDESLGKNKYVSVASEVTELSDLSDVKSYTGVDGRILVYDTTAPAGFNAVTMSGDAIITRTGVVSVLNDSHNHTAATLTLAASSLTDFGISLPADAQGLLYNSATSKWENKSFSGDISVSNSGDVTVVDDSHNHTASTITLLVEELDDVDVSTRVDGSILSWSSSEEQYVHTTNEALSIAFEDITDLDITNRSDGKVIAYDADTNTHVYVSGGGGGGSLDPGTTAGDLTIWDGDTWEPMTVTGDVSIDGSGVTTVADDSHNHTGATISGDLSVTSLETSGDVVVGGDLIGNATSLTLQPDTGTGDIIFKDGAGDTMLTIATGGPITSVANLMPTATNTLDIGSASVRWKNLYLSGLLAVAGGSTITGTTALRDNIAGNFNNGLRLFDNSSYASGVGGALSGWGQYNSAGDYARFGVISITKGSSTDGSQAGEITLRVNTGSTTSSGLRVASDLQVYTASNLNVTGDLAVNGGDITTSSTSLIIGSGTNTILLPSGLVKSGQTTGSNTFAVRGGAGQIRALQFQTGDSPRWSIRAFNDAESGSDAGSTLNVGAYTDAGALIDSPITITRASGGPIAFARPLKSATGVNFTLQPASGQYLNLLSAGGTAVISISPSDNNPYFGTGIYPNGTRNIGSASARWNNIYGNKLFLGSSGIEFEGSADDFEQLIEFEDPVEDGTITVPNITGTMAVSDAGQDVTFNTLGITGSFSVDGTPDENVTIISFVDPTQENEIVFPDESGTVALERPRPIVLTAQGATPDETNPCSDPTRVGNRWVIDFDASADEIAEWTPVLPDTYNGGTFNVKIYWTAASGSAGQKVRWSVRGRSIAHDEALGGSYGTASVADGTLTATGDLHVTEIDGLSLGGTPDANELVDIQLSRDADHVNDNLAADARVILIKLEYERLP